MHRARNKLTPIRITKMFIALAPPAFYTYEAFKAGGAKAAGEELVQDYTGYNITQGDFQTQRLARGWAPLIAAWIFGKVASRVLR